jgi:cysteine desulfurase / selenocysteine lyase
VSTAALDLRRVRSDFPALAQRVHGHRLVYLDNAATTQKPNAVLEAMTAFYVRDCANVHRGAHELSGRASSAYEGARARIGRFIGAASPGEIIFVKGATEGINLVAHALFRRGLSVGDEIVVTSLEHHANFVPWQRLSEDTGAKLRIAPIDGAGALRLDVLESIIQDKTRVVAVAHVSNALGTVNSIESIVEIAHRHGALVLVDGAQAAPHMKLDMRALGADFYVFSAHKLYGPFGIGVLYAREACLEWMAPYQTGGGMVQRVLPERTTFLPHPAKLEAGTPNVAGAVGFAAAVDYLEALGMDRVERHDRDLLDYASGALSKLGGVRLIGTAPKRAALCSFVLDAVHAHDLATILDREGVAIRAGHHCAQPVMDHFGVASTARASFGIYNGEDDVDALVDGIRTAAKVFGP